MTQHLHIFEKGNRQNRQTGEEELVRNTSLRTHGRRQPSEAYGENDRACWRCGQISGTRTGGEQFVEDSNARGDA